ncbi:hypothetical protein BGZ65_010776 [Modicella reniformis]|uniref:Uncharacterized protein n=1 Tax=Modicella reniformis TaxID=1440133 RepID=A0A9P6IMS9_9FUNG|nr:hypothetical protein BGZ65_010776 [Modicella reniformis]
MKQELCVHFDHLPELITTKLAKVNGSYESIAETIDTEPNNDFVNTLDEAEEEAEEEESEDSRHTWGA